MHGLEKEHLEWECKSKGEVKELVQHFTDREKDLQKRVLNLERRVLESQHSWVHEQSRVNVLQKRVFDLEQECQDRENAREKLQELLQAAQDDLVKQKHW